MIYKTLHWYIFKELLRIFVLTASALTILLAFGGTFKPLTKEGIEIGQLMWILFNLMPAMLAYAIPLAALFAAVLVYWRIATDNEVTACRAGGISFWALALPALLLGLVVASADMVFVNYVVPVFLQRTEAGVRRDLGSMVVNKVNRQEPFEWDKLLIFADSAQQEVKSPKETPPEVERRTLVLLNGMAATQMESENQPTSIVVARSATVVIDDMKRGDETRVWVQMHDGASFEPNTFRKLSGSVERLPPDGYFQVPSILKDKPKFLNYIQLRHMEANPALFGKIKELRDSVNRELTRENAAKLYYERWVKDRVLRFEQEDNEYLLVIAPQAGINESSKELEFRRLADKPVRVEQYRGGKLVKFYISDVASFGLSNNESLTRQSTDELEYYGSIRMLNNVYQQDLIRNIPEARGERIVIIQPLEIPESLLAKAVSDADIYTLQKQTAGMRQGLQEKMLVLNRRIQETRQRIGSELHSRGSFALSCLTLVLLGAALGILMGGRNPLVVFVVGFVPAIVLVLLITAGRRMVENTWGSVTPGYLVIWAGNVLLLGLVMGVYARLVRH